MRIRVILGLAILALLLAPTAPAADNKDDPVDKETLNIRDGKKLAWPLALKHSDFDAERKRTDELVPVLVGQARDDNIQPATIKDFNAVVTHMNNRLKEKVDEVSTSHYLAAERYLTQLGQAVQALQVREGKERADDNKHKEAVKKAIDRGVAFLKQAQRKDGSWNFSDHFLEEVTKVFPKERVAEFAEDFSGANVGATALAGWALLESGVPTNDPSVRNAAEFVRKGVPQLDFTHSLGAAILFLDRFNDAKDAIAIKNMADRLVAGQNEAGAWGYHCGSKPKSPYLLLQGPTENSASEFAVMGLWVARHHQAPVSEALNKFEKYCRNNQNADGTFPYSASEMVKNSSPCLTCAGLLGLAYGHGAANETVLLKQAKNDNDLKPPLHELEKDQAVNKGLNALENILKANLPSEKQWIGWSNGFPYMALWSIERVGAVYGREKIGTVNWYNFGARILLERQQKDGSWKSSPCNPSALNTSWALLFLKRSNPAPDLTLILKGTLPQPQSPSDSMPNKQKPVPEPKIDITLPKSKPEK